MRSSVAQFLEVPVENRLIRATHFTSATVKSVLEKRSIIIDQPIAHRSGLPTAVGTMGIVKMWVNSGANAFCESKKQ